jgi:hypothetical protein
VRGKGGGVGNDCDMEERQALIPTQGFIMNSSL